MSSLGPLSALKCAICNSEKSPECIANPGAPIECATDMKFCITMREYVQKNGEYFLCYFSSVSRGEKEGKKFLSESRNLHAHKTPFKVPFCCFWPWLCLQAICIILR